MIFLLIGFLEKIKCSRYQEIRTAFNFIFIRENQFYYNAVLEVNIINY